MRDSFIDEFEKGQQGKNLGLPLGLDNLDFALNGLQRGQIIAIAAAPKVGKSQLALHSFLIHPYLYTQEVGIDTDFIFYSLEMDINQIRHRVAAYFFYHDYNLKTFTHHGEEIPISSNYLLGKLEDKHASETLPSGRKKRVNIKVSEEHKNMLFQIHENRIVPMFGVYEGHKRVRKGAIDLFVDRSDSNPTGIRNHLLHYADLNGRFIHEPFTKLVDGKMQRFKRRVGYESNNPNKYTIIYIDHVRKVPIERGFTIKQNIDKLLEYQVELRNLCNFTFIDIIHLNRGMSNVDRMKYAKDQLFPIPDDIKDTGNISEEADTILTMMDPTDERYNLTKHFDVDIASNPNYRSVHLVESRNTACPYHMKLNSIEGVGAYVPFEEAPVGYGLG